MSELYPGITGSPITHLVGDISAAQTTIAVGDDTALPDAPNICTIGYGENIETIRYGAKSNGVLQNVTRGIEGTPRAWPAGTEVARFFTAYDHNSIIENFNSHLADYENDKINLMIVDSGGDSTNGYWVKWGDGTLIMYFYIRGNDGQNVISNSNQPLPAEFPDELTCRRASFSVSGLLEVTIGGWSIQNHRNIASYRAAGSSKNSCNIRIETDGYVGSGRQLIATIYVIGRWR